MTLAPLYSLADQYQQLLDGLQAAETDEERDALLAAAPDLNEAIEQKMDGCAAVLAELTHRAEGRKKQADRMAALAKADEARVEWLKAYMQRALETMETTRVETARFRVSVVQNPPAVDLFDEKAVPGQFTTIKTTYSVDKVAIRRAIEGGAEVPGARLVQGSHLRVS